MPRLYVPLEVDFPDNARIIEAGERAELLYIRALLLSKRLRSDGLLTTGQVAHIRLSGVTSRAKRLVEVGLWEVFPGGYKISGFLDRNPSSAELDAVSAQRAAAGRSGGRPRKQDALPNGKHGAFDTEKQGASPTEKLREVEPKSTANLSSSESDLHPERILS